jgi:glycosyltransferase involved in cell wall biosynthesis
MLLTIAVPTFNRPDCITERIKELSSLPEELAKMVELLICDNGDFEIPVPHLAGYTRIRYSKNSKNLGLGGNIECCVRKSEGEFVWLLSDDDQIRTENLEELLIRLKQTNSEVIALGDFDESNASNIQSELTQSFPQYWTDFNFLSGCIYKSKEAKNFIVNQGLGVLNATYHQVLIALGMYAHGSRVERWENIFVVDTLTQKNYKVRGAFVARILDLIKLENQLQDVGLAKKAIVQIRNKTDSHILNYLPRMSFEYTTRKDFLELLILVFRTWLISSVYPKRMVFLFFGNILVFTSLLDFRLGRLNVKFLELVTHKKLVEYSFSDIWVKTTQSYSSEASTRGYESE